MKNISRISFVNGLLDNHATGEESLKDIAGINDIY